MCEVLLNLNSLFKILFINDIFFVSFLESEGEEIYQRAYEERFGEIWIKKKDDDT